MSDDSLEQDLAALIATIDDADEAVAVRDLFDIASAIETAAVEEDEFTPFVYPH